MKRVQKGFTLIEVMVVVVIIGILSAIALPSYRDHVMRARLGDAISALSPVQSQAEQYWSNKRTFKDFDRVPAATKNFTFALSGASASAYTVTATGIGQATGFAYTINQNGIRATTVAPAAYGTSATCWVDQKGGKCTE